jgi:hypothetical protein
MCLNIPDNHVLKSALEWFGAFFLLKFELKNSILVFRFRGIDYFFLALGSSCHYDDKTSITGAYKWYVLQKSLVCFDFKSGMIPEPGAGM